MGWWLLNLIDPRPPPWVDSVTTTVGQCSSSPLDHARGHQQDDAAGAKRVPNDLHVRDIHPILAPNVTSDEYGCSCAATSIRVIQPQAAGKFPPDVHIGQKWHINPSIRCNALLCEIKGDMHLFSCSGTTVEFLMGVGYVVTSASLVKLPHEDKVADDLKINVCLPSGEKLKGSVSSVDFYFNLCVVEVPSTLQLPTKRFSADTRIFNFYECHSRDVVALGHLCQPWSLNAALGKLIPGSSQFDCEELILSSCKISKRGVGGPLMDFDGNIIGMNFYDKKETPFLPGFIVLKCLQHFNSFRKVIRPLHGLRVQTLHEAQLTVLEKIHHGFPNAYGVIVDRVEGLSPEHSELKVGDVITHVNGVPFSTAAEFDVKTMRGRNSETVTRTINVDKFTPTSEFNRWRLGRPYLLRRIENGTLYTGEKRG